MTQDRMHLFSSILFASTAPFSHVVVAGGLGHVSGIIGQRRDDGALVGPDVATQALAMLDNLAAVLEEAGFGLADLVATRLYLLDYADFAAINEIWRERLPEPWPARATLQVAALPLGARVQVDATFDARGARD